MNYKETQIRTEVLVELAGSSNGSLATSELISLLSDRLPLDGKDAEIAYNRSDTYFSQKVRNVVSHRNQGTGLESLGLATYDETIEGWTITPLGRKHIASIH